MTVEAAGEMIPQDNGARSDVLSSKDIDNLALEGRDTTELLKVLPGAVTMSGGLTQNNPSFSDLSISANESAIGNGINLNGVPNRGGTALLSDGVSVLDPGDMASSIGIISPEMTAEVSVQTSNFGAYVQNGPVVVSAISKSGTDHYHGDAYFDRPQRYLQCQRLAAKPPGNSQRRVRTTTIPAATSAAPFPSRTRRSSSGEAMSASCRTQATATFCSRTSPHRR